MIRPVGNKILVEPLHRDGVSRQMIAAMKSDKASDLVQKLASEIDPASPGKLVLVTTEPPICGTVIALGKPLCDECRQPITIDVSVGDVVVYQKTAGLELAVDGVEHVMLKPHDLLLIWRPDPVKES